MQKRITTTLTLILLMLTLTQFAAAQWEDNEFTNNTSGDLYVSFTTFRPARDPIPKGWRTVGWYLIRPGASHTFQAWADNPIYYLIWEADTEDYLTPANAKKFAFWEHLDAFVTVSEAEPNVPVVAGDLLYSSQNRGALIETGEFFKSGNGGSVTVNATGVVAPLAEIEEGDEDDEDDDTVARPVPEVPDDVDDTGVSISITPDPIGTTLNQGQTRTLTISLRTANGDPIAGRSIVLDVPDETATFTPRIGETDENGKLTTTLKVAKDRSEGTLKVTVQELGSNQKGSFSFPVKIGVSQLSLSRSPSTIEPGQRSTVTITARTPGGIVFPNAQLSLSATQGNISPTLVTTNAQGQAQATYTANAYNGTPHPNTISTPSITATSVSDTAVKGSTSLTVRYVPSSLSVSGVQSSITSGNTMKLTATVKSRSGKAMRNVPVSFSEGSRYLRFSSSRVNTNSSGQASSTLRTGGKTSGARFTVSTSGVSTRTYTIRVNPEIRTTTRSFDRKGAVPPVWEGYDIHDYTHTLTFPGRVVSADPDCLKWNNTKIKRIAIQDPSENKVKVYFTMADATWVNRSRLKCTITGKYEVTASVPGAPPLQPQLRPEIDELSSVWKDLSQVPSETALLPNYPNPFNPETWIPYHLSDPAEVALSIYAADGRLVRTLALGHQPAGIYESKSRAAYWDGQEQCR